MHYLSITSLVTPIYGGQLKVILHLYRTTKSDFALDLRFMPNAPPKNFPRVKYIYWDVLTVVTCVLK